MSLDNKRDILEKTIALAKQYGAEECDVLLATNESLSMSSNQKKIDKYKVSNAQTLGIRVVKNQKIGLAYSESLDDDALSFVAKSAVENSEYSNVNLHEKINVKNLTAQTNHQQQQEENISLEEQMKFAIALEEEVLKVDSRIINVPYTGLSSSKNRNYYLNSLGTYTEASYSHYSCYTSATAKKESHQTSFHYGQSVKSFKDLDLATVVKHSTEHALNLLDATTLETGKYDVVFDIEQLESIIGCFSNYFSGKAAVEKTNPFEEKLGQAVASSEFSMIDSPQYKDALFPSYFDDEGNTQKEMPVIENGVLKNFHHNSATASFFGIPSTGHAARSAKSALGTSNTTYVIKSGKHSDEEVLKGQYIELKDLMGLHSGANSISGEFSFAANGYLCENGVRLKAISGFTVAGNFATLLKEIKMIGTTIHANESRSFFAPTIRFSELSVAGK